MSLWKIYIQRQEQRPQLIDYLTMCFGDGQAHTTDAMAQELAEDAPEGLTPEIWPSKAIGNALGRLSGKLAGWKPCRLKRNVSAYQWDGKNKKEG